MTTAITHPQQQSIANTTADWSRSLNFAQFNPSLGTLTGVAFGLTGDVAGSVVLDNLDRAPAAFGVAFDGELQLFGPDGSYLAAVAPVATDATTLAASAITTLTGIIGSSGTTADFEPSTQPGGLALAPYIGTGSVPLTVGAQATLQVSGPGNMMLVSRAAAGASVTLQYDYTPANNGGGGGTYGSGLQSATFFGGVPIEAGVTTAPQTFNFADRTTAWNDRLAVNRFDPSLGTLESVNITLSDNVLAGISAENLGSTAATFSATDTATLTLDLPGNTPTETVAAAASDSMSLAAFDGGADFVGASGHTDNVTAQSSIFGTTQIVTDPADLAAFTGQNVVVLPIAGTSAATINGPGDLMAGLLTEAGGTATVSYTYLPPTSAISGDSTGTTGAADYTVSDTTTNQPGVAQVQNYAADGADPQQQLLDYSGDNLDVSVTSDNWVIGTGAGNDVIVAHGGDNILCGGAGSNWLVGAGGDDTFMVHAGGGGAWSTVVNFHAGDWLMVSGLSPQTAAMSWVDGQGSPGNTGLTLDATAPDGSATLVTLAHYFSIADLANGRLTTGFGGDPTNGSNFFYIHANN